MARTVGTGKNVRKELLQVLTRTDKQRNMRTLFACESVATGEVVHLTDHELLKCDLINPDEPTPDQLAWEGWVPRDDAPLVKQFSLRDEGPKHRQRKGLLR